MKKYLIIIACLLILLICQCKRTKSFKNRENENITAMSDTICYYINKLGTLTASIKTLRLDKSQLERTLLIKDKKLAALTSEFDRISHITKYSSITILDTIKADFNDTIPCVFERKGIVSDDWYCFKYISTQKGVIIDSLSLPTQTTIITGIKRNWFLGSESLTTAITNSNPCINVTQIQSAEIFLNPPWYKKWYIWLAAGLAGGILTVK
jgi:hypothetical protein